MTELPETWLWILKGGELSEREREIPEKFFLCEKAYAFGVEIYREAEGEIFEDGRARECRKESDDFVGSGF